MKSRVMVLVSPLFLAILLYALLSSAVQSSAMAQSLLPGQQQIKINEFMASNDSVLEDPDAPGKFPDWLELYNPTDNQVSLDGLVLINGELLSDPIRFPITKGLFIPPRGFVIFYADDDTEEGPYHTNFRLNKDGDRIGLYADLDGNDEIDARAFGLQTTDYSEGHEPDGGPLWRQYSRPTPGQTNVLQPPLIRDVVHSPELPTSSDTVEVSANISDDGTIVSASVVFSRTGLAAVTVPMANMGGERYTGEIPPQPSGSIVHYYVTASDDEGQISPNPDLAQVQYYRYPVDYTKPTLTINELMASNLTAYEDPDDPGNFPDWFEIYNHGTSAVSLGGLFLTDNMDNPTKFPISSSLTIAPGGFMVFIADEQGSQGPNHTNFKIDRSGESVAIFGAEGSVRIDRMKFEDAPTNGAIGRLPDGPAGVQQYLPCVSPGEPNIDCGEELFVPSAPTFPLTVR